MDKKVYICCFSGGKDSTAMLIHIIEKGLPLDEIIYCDVGSWMWDSAKSHIESVKQILNVKITVLPIFNDLKEGFDKYGFPSMLVRWCTGIKRDTMKKYCQNKYPDKEIVQYIGYCADEKRRTSKKLYSYYDTLYPLVEAGITCDEAKKICFNHGFDFGGIYEHHSHFNCWLCPLQRKNELRYIYEHCPDKWEQLRALQLKTSGYYANGKSIFQYEHIFWKEKCEMLKEVKKMDK